MAVAAPVARLAAVACALASALGPSSALAGDVGQLGGDRLDLDLTETSIVAQRFDARDSELPQDSGWGQWINRLDAALRWGRWTAALRLDSAVYWRRPADNPNFSELTPAQQDQVLADGESRFANSLYPAKLAVTYAAPGLELTVGDAYAQFGRGLTLSLRKIDELGIDTTLRGVKLAVQRDPFALTAVAGLGNPSRVDEATGRGLFPTHDLVVGDRSLAVFGSDRIVGVEIQAGRGLPVTLSSRVSHVARCAPYHHDASGGIVTDFASDPGGVAFGSCDAADTSAWLQQLGYAPVSLAARDVTMIGQSLEVPSLGGHGKLYVEAATQQRRSGLPALDANGDGNALYGALSLDAGRLAATLEVKSNRNFFVVPASIDPSRAGELSVVAYSFVPPAETFDMIDTEGTGNFNACVDGGRLRLDVNASKGLLVYAQGIYASTRSEQSDGGCDAWGRTRASVAASHVRDRVWDGIGGLEWYFRGALSHVFVWAGARDDVRDDGDWTYR